jgi:hypothetical protein
MRKLLPALVLVLGACAGGEASAPAAESSAPETSQSQAPQASEAVASQGADSGSKAPAADVPGGITLTIGDETWDFAGALCAYTNAPAGEAGSEWNVSYLQDDNQVYVNDDSFGQEVSITDVVNYGTFQWVADGDDLMLTVDGNDVHAEGTFRDDATGAPSQYGSLDATCASWFEG